MVETIYPSLKEYASEVWDTNERYRGLGAVLAAIEAGACEIRPLVESARLNHILGDTGKKNIHGETVQRLDSVGSDIFIRTLSDTGTVAAIGSEEISDPVIIGNSRKHNYLVQTDPIDGSSNIDVAVSIGSIFGIWCRGYGDSVTEESLMRPGNEQVAAAYVLYGTSTVMVVAVEGSVQGFTLDTPRRVFRLTHPDVRFPNHCQYYSINEGNFDLMDDSTQHAVVALRQAHSLRYVGSLVADFHRNLLKGGVFLYPGDLKIPEGKLRLMYEANPLGYVACQAGGAASNGRQPVMDIMPENLHQRTPLIVGNKHEVEEIVALISATS